MGKLRSRVQGICPRVPQEVIGWSRIQIQISLARSHHGSMLFQSDTLENRTIYKIELGFYSCLLERF